MDQIPHDPLPTTAQMARAHKVLRGRLEDRLVSYPLALAVYTPRILSLEPEEVREAVRKGTVPQLLTSPLPARLQHLEVNSPMLSEGQVTPYRRYPLAFDILCRAYGDGTMVEALYGYPSMVRVNPLFSWAYSLGFLSPNPLPPVFTTPRSRATVVEAWARVRDTAREDAARWRTALELPWAVRLGLLRAWKLIP